MTVYYAEWTSKTGKDLAFDLHECSGFDLEKVLTSAQNSYNSLSSREKQEMYISILEIPYIKENEDADNINKYGYDPDALDWDKAGGNIEIGCDD